MNKLPTKQIYLLMIIVFGIVTLSIYSTYSIFTLESESSDIVSIHTPSNLSVSLTSYEYQQVVIPANSFISTDIDIYNNFSYDICYSIWYKIATKNIDKAKVKIYQNTSEALTTSGVISPVASNRVNILITNDNDRAIKVNLGLANTEEKDTCELNLSGDKTLITNVIDNPKVLTNTIMNNNQVVNKQAGYLTYRDIENNISLNSNDKISVSDKYTYQNELFTLSEPKEISFAEVTNYEGYYTCLANSECQTMYHIVSASQVDSSYAITKYELLFGYTAGNNGLRKVNNDYYFYGDNPDNYLYFNCVENEQPKTCELWRVVGLIYDQNENKYLTKIIKDDYILKTKYSGDKQEWNGTAIYKYFAEDYDMVSKDYVKEIRFKQENIVSLETPLSNILYYNKEVKATATIMSLSDYLNASICENRAISGYNQECLKNNWLNKNNSTNEWTSSIKYEEPYKDELTEEIITPDNNTAISVGSEIVNDTVTTELNIRPAVYLKNRILLTGGNGTFENPYMIR